MKRSEVQEKPVIDEEEEEEWKTVIDEEGDGPEPIGEYKIGGEYTDYKRQAVEAMTRDVFSAMMNEATNKAIIELRKNENSEVFARYENDPVGFCRDVLGDTFTDDVIKVMESVRDNPVTIARSANAAGKSYAAARVALWFFLCKKKAKVFCAAAPPIENLKMILWGNIRSVVKNNPGMFTGLKVSGLRIIRDDEIFMAGVAIPVTGDSHQREAKFSGKHAPNLLFVVDEGDAVPEEVYKGIESCASGGNFKLLIMFNPRDKSGPVYQKEIHHQANVVELSAYRHPNVITGKDVVPGAVTREVTARRINEWTRVLAPGEKPNNNCMEVPEFLVGTVAKAFDGKEYPPLPGGVRLVEQPEYWYMVEGQYPAQGSRQLINEVWISDARARHDVYKAQYGDAPPLGVHPILGGDMADFGADSNIICKRYGGYVAPFIFWQGMDIISSADRIYEEYFRSDADSAMIDSNGVGAGVVPTMARRARKENKSLVVWGVKAMEKPSPLIKSELGEFKILRDQLWWALREWLRTDPGAMLPNDITLLEELRIVTYDIPGNGKIMVMDKERMREVLHRSPDRSDALCLTFYPFQRARFIKISEGQMAGNSNE